jgi:hypothetical protein
MAWQAIVAALPGMIISIVIEKLVSLIVPAAGAIMTIIQGLMAAWNTISKIIAAFGKFFTFLKAVKAGPAVAACLFADAVAAGVVALLDFITNFLLTRLKSAGKSVGTKLKGIAQRIMKGLAKAGKGARKAVGGAVNRARTGLRNAAAALRGPRGRQPALAGHPSPRTRPGPSRRPGERRTPDREPARRPGGREDARRPEREPEPPRHRDAEKPKANRPRPPVSRVGQALKRAKGAVKGALKKVGNAARALGRKLKNSKLGRALTNSARKMRDALKRQRDRLRDKYRQRQQRRKQQRDERRKREKSPEAKEARLARIVEKLRPKVAGLLKRGVRGSVLRAVLGGLRVWYRLTQLAFGGERAVDFRATLNPTLVFLHGVAFVVDDLLSFVHKVGGEIARAPLWARKNAIPGAAPQPDTSSAAGRVHDISSLRGDELQELMRAQPRRKVWSRDILRHQNPSGTPVDVEWRQWRGGTPKNRGVYFGIRDRKVDGRSPMPWRDQKKDPRNQPSIPLSYEELSDLFGSWRGPRSVRKQQVIARNALNTLAGAPPRGPNPRFTMEVAALMVHQETMRNAATAVTGAMLLDMAGRGSITMQQAAAMHPMGIVGAKRGSEELQQHLMGDPGPGGVGRVRSNNPESLSTEAREVRLRETAVIEAWVRSLMGEMVVDSQATADEKRKQIRRQIRERMHRIYGIDPQYTALRQSMDGM